MLQLDDCDDSYAKLLTSSSDFTLKSYKYPTAPARVIPSLVPKDSYGFFILSYGMCAGYILMSVMMSLQEI